MFNEKMQWLKINDRKPIYTQLVDKYEARKFVAEKIGEKYLIPLLGIWNNIDEIDFEMGSRLKLPIEKQKEMLK
ncbi:MAG: hypothetical protein FWH22_09010 [Fibromonadales bacterium]|nr:hypothetical protein [Fibromonadales bacterium]